MLTGRAKEIYDSTSCINELLLSFFFPLGEVLYRRQVEDAEWRV